MMMMIDKTNIPRTSQTSPARLNDGARSESLFCYDLWRTQTHRITDHGTVGRPPVGMANKDGQNVAAWLDQMEGRRRVQISSSPGWHGTDRRGRNHQRSLLGIPFVLPISHPPPHAVPEEHIIIIPLARYYIIPGDAVAAASREYPDGEWWRISN